MFRPLLLLLFLPFFSGYCQVPWGIIKIGNGSHMNFRVDKIFINPNSNPNQVFNNFNIPDSMEMSIIVVNKKQDTVFVQKGISLEAGEYQFFLNFNMYPTMITGEYEILFEFHKNGEVIYYTLFHTLFLSSASLKRN